MNHLIILRELTPQELGSVSGESNTFYFFDQRLMDSFPIKGNQIFVNVEPELKNEINFNVLKALSQVPLEIVKNPKLKEGMDQSISYWYYHRFRAYMNVRNGLYNAQTIEGIQKETGANLVIFSTDKLFVEYFEKTPAISVKNSPVQKKQRINYGPLLKFALKSVWHSFTSIQVRKRFLSKDHILITGQNQRSIDKTTGKIQNVYLGRILEIDEDIGCLEQYIIPKIKGQAPILPSLTLKNQKKKAPTIISSYVLLSTLMRRSRRKKIKKAGVNLKACYAEIDGINSLLVRLLLKEVQQNHSSSLLYALQYLGFSDLLKKSRAKTLIGIDENSPNTKSIFDAAKDLGIKTIGIQHGSIHPLNPAYIYSEEDLQLIQLPDYTMAWGDYSKDVLTQNSIYKETQVIVIGQPRTDFILAKLKEKSTLVDEILATKNKTAVFATQPQRDENLRKSTAIDVIRATENIDNTQLVLKIHPGEKKEYYEKIVSEVKPEKKVFLVKNELDIYQTLNMADVVLTCFSTVGAEAAILKKPLITVDYLDQDILEYSKMNIALKTTNKEELFGAMHALLTDPTTLKRFKHDEFIQNFAYKIDGKVAERFWENLHKISADSLK